MSCSSHGTSGRTLGLCFPVSPLFSWESSSSGCGLTREGSIVRFLPRWARGGSGLRTVEMEVANVMKTPQSEHSPTRTRPLLVYMRPLHRILPISRASKAYRSLLYAVTVFISFFLMLVFMTYNVRDFDVGYRGSRLTMTATGVFDSGDRRGSWYRALPLFRNWLGRRRKRDGLSLRPPVRAANGLHKHSWRSLSCPFFLPMYVFFKNDEYTHSRCLRIFGWARSNKSYLIRFP